MRLMFPLAALALLAGCGKAKNPQTKTSKTVVTVWAHEGQPAEKKALTGVVEAFNASHDDVVAKIEFKQEQGYNDRLNAAAMARDLPDVVEIDGPYTAQHADNGILVPIILPKKIEKDFLPTILAQGTYKERLYTVGAFESTVVIFFDKKIAAECDVKPPSSIKDAWSWSDFLDALRKIKKKRPDLIPLETFMVWKGEWLTYAFTPLIWSNDGRILAADGTTTKGCLNGAPAVEPMNALQTLFTEKLSDMNAPAGQFIKGKAAMSWGVFNRWPLYENAEIDFGMSPLPGLKKSSSPSGSWCWGLTSKCENEEAAMKVLLWLVDPEHGVKPICEANGGIPARISALDLMPNYFATRKLFVDQLKETARARPSTPDYATLTKETSRAIGDVANGAKVKQTLDAACERVDAVLNN